MVEYQLDQTFAALGDATRRDILARLMSRSRTVSELAEPYEISLNAVSKHVKVLEDAGLVRRSVEGRIHWLTLNPSPLREAEAWVARYRRFWEERLDALEEFFTARRKRKEGRHARHRRKD